MSNDRILKVLFLCTGNSARSQIAEAILGRKGAGRFEVGSAGSRPAERVNPMAVEVLQQVGIDWSDRQPKNIDAVLHAGWDIIITVCDRAKEACPVFPGQPITAHWGMPDPADVEDSEQRRRAFHETMTLVSRRIDLLLALPFAKLEKMALEGKIRSIGGTGLPTPTPEGMGAH
jgi:arsenate reductase (thioredoxin)